ncbi:MAG: sugar phosphate isomerase/epimerase, partial [Acutalibacter sp.]|nr:sugar phosphate isomerase/epimerase [Acutalibacter sp.]
MAVFATFFDHILDMARQRDISVDKALEETRALGVTQVEVSAATARQHMDALTKSLAGLGMTISSLPVFFDFGRNTDIEGQAGPIFELAKDLNADRLLVIPGFTQGTPEETEIQTRNMLEGTARLGQLAEKAGLSLVMEDFDGAAAPFATSAGMLRFLDACPQLSACFDTG